MGSEEDVHDNHPSGRRKWDVDSDRDYRNRRDPPASEANRFRGRERSTDRKRRRRSDSPPSVSTRRDREYNRDSNRQRHRDRDDHSDPGLKRREGTDRLGRENLDRNRDRDRDRGRDKDRDRHFRRKHSLDDRAKREEYTTNSKPRIKEESQDQKDLSSIRRRGPLPSQQASFAIEKGDEPEPEVEKPNFSNTGLLAAASNSVAQSDGTTIQLKYHEPAEARKPPPKDDWKLFVFKGSDIVDTVPLSNRSCWLIGRDAKIVDFPAEHPSISKQHAVIQFRHVEKRNEYGDKIGKTRPYLLDLESANGTMLNGEEVPPSRYLELKDKDMVQFGDSTREYVLMLAPRD